MTNSKSNGERSVLASLRLLIPVRQTDFAESLIIAELQANRLLLLTNTANGPMPPHLICQMPRIEVHHKALPTSGMSFWDNNAQTWVIYLNASEPLTRQRFTLLHEYKHIIDHGRTDLLYTGSDVHTAARQAELAADYFAGCALMPKWLMKRARGAGLQTARALAEHFDVSVQAVEVRLAQLGLQAMHPSPRCAPHRVVQGYRLSKRQQAYYRRRTSQTARPSVRPNNPLELSCASH